MEDGYQLTKALPLVSPAADRIGVGPFGFVSVGFAQMYPGKTIGVRVSATISEVFDCVFKLVCKCCLDSQESH